MATSLTPELLKQLQDYYQQSSSGYVPQGAQEFGGQMYQQNVNQGGYAGEGGDGGSFTPYGYTSYKPGATTGDKWSQYDTKGDFSREGILKEDPWLKNLLTAGIGALGMSMIPVGAAGVGGGAGGFGAVGDAFMPGAAAGDAFMPGAMSIGGNVGTAGVLPGLEGYLVTGAAGAAGGGSSSLLGKIGSGLTSMAGGGGSSLLGLGASALGGLAGGQGQSADNSQTRKMDPRLDQPVFGGLVPGTQQLLAQQMTPERMAGYRQMQTAGQSLLGRPISGNNFERFYGGR